MLLGFLASFGTVLAVLLAVLIVIITYLYGQHLKAKALVAHIPGFSQFVPFFLSSGSLSRDTLHKFAVTDFIPKYGKIFKIATFKYPVVFVADPDLLKDVLVKNAKTIDKNQTFYESFDYFGPNILTYTGDDWRKHRVLCNSAFADNHIKHIVEVTATAMQRLFNNWEASYDTTKPFTINTLDQMMRITLQVIGDSGFGYDLRAIEADYTDFDRTKYTMSLHDALIELNTGVLFRMKTPKYTWKLPFGRFKRLNDAAADFKKYMEEIITNRRNNPEELESRHDLLSLLLNSTSEEYQGVQLSNEELQADTFMFLLAGHETTASLMLWTLYLLAKHPDKQKKLQEELDRVLSDNRVPTYDDIQNELLYNQYVLKETLRVQPSVISVGKVCKEDATVGNYVLKAGTMVQTLIYALHRDKDHWDNPDDFIPERWDESLPTYKKPNPFAYIPFSMGQRNCIGSKFATLESRTILAMIMKNYSVELTPELIDTPPKEKLIITIQVQEPLYLVVKKR